MNGTLERTSPLLGFYHREGFALTEGAGMRTGQTRRVDFAGGPFLADLSPLPRRLVCGRGAEAWLAAAGMPVPAVCAWAGFGRDGFVARLGPGEWLLSAGGATALPAADVGASEGRGELLCLEQEFVEIALGGPDCGRIFAELTATDLAQFGAGAFVPLLLAGNECWLRALPAPRAHSRIYCAPADGAYVFGTLLDLVREAGGALFGLDDFLSAYLTDEGHL